MKFSPSQRHWFIGATVCTILTVIVTILLDLLLAQWRPTVELGSYRTTATLSERSRATLTDTTGDITITCIFPTESPIALPVGRLVRIFKEVSQNLAGANLSILYVDPRIETHAAAQLMAQGANGPGLLFRQVARTVFIPEQALLSPEGNFDPSEAEAAITAAITRLSREDGITIGWLTGHGEPSFTSTDPQTGFSGLRRTLENEGCQLKEVAIDVTSPENAAIPKDINMLMIVNPRYPVSAMERAILSDWLDRGGRIFCALPHAGDAGLAPLLERWGMRMGTQPRHPLSRTEGDAGLTQKLSDKHIITRELAGQTSMIFRAPRALVLTPLRGITLTPLVEMDVNALPTAPSSTTETIAIMASAERGSRVGADLALRPGRLLVAGESGFAENHYVLNHASANRDLLVNAIRWLTGLSGSGAQSGSGIIRIPQDRTAWYKDLLITAFAVPFAICLIIGLLTRRRV